MYPRRMMIAGVILVLAAIAIIAFGLVMIGEEENYLKKAIRFDGYVALSTRLGDMVIVEGKVSVKNRVLMHDFVYAAKENNDDGSWSIMEVYSQPVLADLARGEIILTADHICTRAEENNVLETDEMTPNNDKIRYIGLKRGDPITAIGTLTSLDPDALAVKHWYLGSVNDYKNSLTLNRRNSYIFCLIIVVLGAGLFLWGLKIRQTPPSTLNI